MKTILDFCGAHPFLMLLFLLAVYEITSNICKTIINVTIVLKTGRPKPEGGVDKEKKSAINDAVM